jgi:hypothetical protein
VLLRRESSHGARETEAGADRSPWCPLYREPRGHGMPHNTLYRYTIAELTTGVLSHCSLHHHGTILGTMAGVMVMGLSHLACT